MSDLTLFVIYSVIFYVKQLSGHRIVGVRMVLTDGAHHEVDSSEWAFYQASQFAMSDCSDDGTWQILEPIMKVEVTGPEEFQVLRK